MRQRAVLLAASLVLTVLPAGHAVADAPDALPAAVAAVHDGIPGSLLVTTTGHGAQDLVRALAAGLPGLPGPFKAMRLTAAVAHVRVPQGSETLAGTVLRGLPGVIAVEPDRYMQIQRVPNDPRYLDQWSHQRTSAEEGWDTSIGGQQRIAIIDSGILGTHPDLAPNIRENQVSTAADGPAVVRGKGVDNDPCQIGHGTFVAGVAAARGNNGIGITGVAWEASIVDISTVSGAPGSATCEAGLADSAILRAFNYALDNPGGPVDVINMSFGRADDRCPVAYQASFKDARKLGVVLVGASGNGELEPDEAGKPMVPASCDNVISVGATRRDDTRAGYSTTNAFVDLMAPGGDEGIGVTDMLLSTTRGPTGYGRETGTSHSAPYVAAAAALVRAVDPDLTPDQIESVLERTATDLGRPGRDNGTGWGLVNLDAALARAGLGSVPASEPDPSFPVNTSEPAWAPPTVARIAAAGTITAADTQAAAVSRSLFAPGEATHAVLARSDDFADALAGSALGNGYGPLLFTPRTGPLSAATRTELTRAVSRRSTVYLLGGTSALPAALEDELRGMNYEPVRLSGPSREQTAVAVAQEVRRRGLWRMSAVLLARSDQWPDAVAGGSLAAWYGTPVLLTPPTALHPATRDALALLQPSRIYALGGEAALATPVLRAAGTAAGVPVNEQMRLSGAGRAQTAVAIARELESLLRSNGEDPPRSVLAVNLSRRDGFAHALSASMLSGATAAVMVPVDGNAGTSLSTDAQDYVRGFGVDGLLMGGADVISDQVGEQLKALLRG